ncbi:MAG: XRE family transcriptional regulator [Mesorhizobium sp.]|uniref:helix-turn-helix transcriptional regulator n=1 Tax=Mesorhizobium sp. TaxID=1871066 RepID=UPI000FE3181F|nr:helix-turn-helix transcriptional regulator [Mesorhizobium sp.]RWG11359.1 MAG: XRE family transcriptional regulator [Mesorhizobium sp.]RWI97926.1 MAG: XRE family transcriptional regulator [Mesorhizobium sp.]RWK26949.1 MAG: XRE family transcriptional regulator [Mesorhizobium sp.]TIQ07788.1 MAG: helix-turn-helix transcriptional regulator [Mesorhizobium sp.]TIR22086.1 MAG: helix-turn-helix transcriptional regulator [Mesorhizobium sp.]
MTKNTQNRPYANTRLAKFVERRILELRPRKTQSAIATEAGFGQHNMLTNIKLGNSKLPLDRVPALAKALEVDPAFLFTMAVDQLGGDTTELAIRKIFGTLVTENETAWLEEIRKASDYSDPSLTSRSRAVLRGIFGK